MLRMELTTLYQVTFNISNEAPPVRTQAQFAKMLKSSQSRVAKMEKGDPTVSVDLLVKSLLALGADKKCIARAIT